ncbi:stalk domain-containing protein [Paenibacillus sp. GCM10028914]|uniref:stalk domain-containing protein n=1 Tax=Paenibacillus sp. GCM10028914 TaxID=3273416 RepID=UPI00360673D8
MRKFWTALLVGILIVPLLFQSQAQAAVKFTILIDGVKLSTSQAPVMIQGRVMLPMRAIFEALDAKVTWNQKAQTVTAVKDRTTVVLKINSKTATINKQSVKLDVPAKNLKGTTMVPVRFVSESLGEKVGWNSKTKTVSITTSSGGGVTTPDNSLYPVSYVTLRDVGNSGDGRDLQVNFAKSVTESRVGQYRVMIVKSSKSSSFNVSAAQMVPSYNYTVVYPSGSDPSVTLTSGSRDVDGDYIRDNQAYTAYVLAIGKTSNEVVLSSASPAITLTNTNAVESASNVKGNDVNDYNDGRDLSVSFTRAKNESIISNYRVIAVKTKDISRFDLAAAKSLPSQNYTTVSKTNSSNTTLSTTLSSSSRDSSGEYIKNGVAYTLYVLSVSSNENTVASKLSSGSSSITLATGSTTAPVITSVTDVNDYGDGRDLRVSFTKLSNESSIGSYRIFVVKSNDYHNFNLSKANSVSSYNYTQVNKTGNNITHTLSSGARDVDGATIRSGVYYRVFVMAVGTGNNSGNNSLSSVSSDIILNNNTNVGTISSLSVSDVSDYGDGRDLQVSFNRASDEYNISHYQAFVVKSNKVNNFDLNKANSLSNSYYYTQINKTGYNISQILNSSSRDTDGELIKNGVSYRVFILSVGNNNSTGNNALSSYSSTISLSNNRNVSAVTNVRVDDVRDNNNGSDLNVSFTRAYDESPISHYQAFVVKSGKANNFNLNTASSNNYYTQINKTGYDISQSLSSSSRDTDGDYIREGTSYRVFIMSVGYNNYAGNNALSSYSSAITLGKTLSLNPATSVEVQDIGDNDNGSDLQVKFTRSSDYSNISEYRILVVKNSKAGNFNLTAANAVNDYTKETSQNGTITRTLAANAKDTDGEAIKDGIEYSVFVLAIGKNNLADRTAISTASNVITLTNKTPVNPVTDVTAMDSGDNGDGRDLFVTFKKASNEKNIDHYRIYVVPKDAEFKLDDANRSSHFKEVKVGSDYRDSFSQEAKDSSGNKITNPLSYKVFVLSVSKDKNSSNNALSASSEVVTLEGPGIAAPTNVKATANEYGFNITFSPGQQSKNVEEYRVMLVPASNPKDNLEDVAHSVKATVNSTSKDFGALLEKDIYDAPLSKDLKYNAYVLAVNKSKSAKNALSEPLENLELLQPGESAASSVTVEPAKDKNSISVSFKTAMKDSEITSYQIVFLPADSAGTFNLKKAAASTTLLRMSEINPPQSEIDGTGETGTGTGADTIKKYTFKIPGKDGNGADIQAGKEYKAIILSHVVKDDKSTEIVAVSNPSKGFVLVAAKAKK